MPFDNCNECGALIHHFSDQPPHQPCFQCRHKDDVGKTWDSDTRVRCPACGCDEPAMDWDGSLHEEGSHEISCGHCGHQYTIETTVTFNFCSPERMEGE